MAYTSIHSIKATDGAALRYITNGDKTVNGLYVQSYACRADSRGAAEDFRAVRATGTGRTTILAHHLIQSFEPGEITPEQALQIGEELCDRLLMGNYQYVLSVHTDKDHIHCHIIFNNTNLYNGLSFTTEHNQGKVNERSWAKVRAISDEICKAHGLSVIEPKGKGVSYFEHAMQIQGKSWKDKLRSKIAEIAFYSKDFNDFLQKCSEYGIEYVYKPSNKVKLKFRLKDEGQQRFTRADTLGEEYTPERIAEQIEQIQQRLSSAHTVAEPKTTEKSVTPPKPFTAPKTEKKPTPPQPITPQNDHVYKPLTEDEFDKIFGISSPTTDEPAPVESEPTEKKEDVWAAIRGMGKADEIISALETVGITSYSEFTGFMLNTTHKDDHTEELADLKSHINTVKAIINKMKNRDELKPVYKEYQSKSGWAQSRFKKKNADTIEDYEEAVKYIKEHSTKYTSDRSIPSIEDMKGLLKRMIDRRDEILPEHKAFLAKKQVAQQYTQAVRSYRNQQTNKRAAEQSRQRKLSRQIKKDTLE